MESFWPEWNQISIRITGNNSVTRTFSCQKVYSKITGWSSRILSRGGDLLSHLSSVILTAQVRAEPAVRTCNPKSPGHPVVFEFTKTPSPSSSLPPTLNICPLTENKGGNQSWYRCWEDVQSSATDVKHERRAIEIRPENSVCSNCFQRRQTRPDVFFLSSRLSLSFLKWILPCFTQSSWIICSIWGEEGGRQAGDTQASSLTSSGLVGGVSCGRLFTTCLTPQSWTFIPWHMTRRERDRVNAAV